MIAKPLRWEFVSATRQEATLPTGARTSVEPRPMDGRWYVSAYDGRGGISVGIFDTEAGAKAAAQREADKELAEKMAPEARYALIVGIERVTETYLTDKGYEACVALNLLRILNLQERA